MPLALALATLAFGLRISGNDVNVIPNLNPLPLLYSKYIRGCITEVLNFFMAMVVGFILPITPFKFFIVWNLNFNVREYWFVLLLRAIKMIYVTEKMIGIFVNSLQNLRIFVRIWDQIGMQVNCVRDSLFISNVSLIFKRLFS